VQHHSLMGLARNWHLFQLALCQQLVRTISYGYVEHASGFREGIGTDLISVSDKCNVVWPRLRLGLIKDPSETHIEVPAFRTSTSLVN
jgi:hypothetical protein